MMAILSWGDELIYDGQVVRNAPVNKNRRQAIMRTDNDRL